MQIEYNSFEIGEQIEDSDTKRKSQFAEKKISIDVTEPFGW